MEQVKGIRRATRCRLGTAAAVAALCLALIVVAGGCSKPSTTSATATSREIPTTAASTAAASASKTETAASSATSLSPAPAAGAATSAGAGQVQPGVSPNQPPSGVAVADNAVAKAALPRLVDLGAKTCIPCKKMAPILEELAETQKAHFGVEFIDVRENPSMAKPYSIRFIPTQIFFDAQGRELYRHIGFYSREEILAKWRELGLDVGS
jgi:thioredoxin 1